MKPLIDIDPKHLPLIKEILKHNLPKGTKVWVFGSRANHTAKPFSDLDLAIEAHTPLSFPIYVQLKNAFDESPLPFKVDLVDWHQVDQSFKEHINNFKKIRLY